MNDKYNAQTNNMPGDLKIRPAAVKPFHLTTMEAMLEETERRYQERKKRAKPVQGSTMTDQQLRALNRRHLLIIIRDLEKELKQIREEKENMLIAFRAGAMQTSQVNQVEGYE